MPIHMFVGQRFANNCKFDGRTGQGITKRRFVIWGGMVAGKIQNLNSKQVISDLQDQSQHFMIKKYI